MNQTDKVVITNPPKSLTDKIKAIADKMNVPQSTYLKSKINEIINQYPENMKVKDNG